MSDSTVIWITAIGSFASVIVTAIVSYLKIRTEGKSALVSAADEIATGSSALIVDYRQQIKELKAEIATLKAELKKRPKRKKYTL